jgi:hypothetical protein
MSRALLDFLRPQGYSTYLFDPYSGPSARASAGAFSDNMIAVPGRMSLPEAVYRPWPMVGHNTDAKA